MSVVDSIGEDAARRALEVEIEQEWALVSVDGGSRWFVGRVVKQGDASTNGRLQPVYGYSVSLGADGKFQHDVVPILALAGRSLGVELSWSLVIECGDMTPGELRRLAEMILRCEGRKSELAIHASGLVRASKVSAAG